jgi:toxin ParE1/3/4
MARIQLAVAGLDRAPSRGAIPAELAVLGNREFREVFFKPYRIIYRVTEGSAEVVLVADGRRDMRTLLQRRLLGS